VIDKECMEAGRAKGELEGKSGSKKGPTSVRGEKSKSDSEDPKKGGDQRVIQGSS